MTIIEIKSQIMNYDYVSFDLYDTLVFRTVDLPRDVWILTEKIFNQKHNRNLLLFKEIRIAAERRARKDHNGKEVTLNDIYNNLPYPQKVKNELKELEQQIEISVTVPNTEMIEVLNYCRERGKTIVVTTDMYLPKETIVAVLHKNGIYYDHLFLSNEVGVTKLSGKLFPDVLLALKAEPKQMIHIGDNLISDIQKANEAGICSCLRIKKDILHIGHRSSKRNDIFADHINHYIEYKLSSRHKDVYYEIGYAVLGPILFELCEYIERYRNAEEIDEIAFVAREGFILKKAYELLYDKKRSHYVRINKNVLRFPSLYLNQSIDTFLDTIPNSHTYSWKTLLNYFPGVKSISKNSNKEIERKDLLNGLYSTEFEEIFSQFNDQFKEQFDLLVSYLDCNDLIDKKIMLVNNSINGNGQYMLSKLYDNAHIPVKLLGIQMVKSSKCRKKLRNNVKSYFDDKKMPTLYSGMFDYCTLLFEHLMFENSGTAIAFTNTDPVGVLCEPIGEEARNLDTIRRIQDAALEFVEDYKDCMIPIGKQAMYSFFDLFLKPTKEEAEILGNIIDKEADTIEPLISRMKWRQAEMIIHNQNVNGYNRKLFYKSTIKGVLDRLNLLDYFIK